MMFEGKRAAVHTLGCKVNEYEADVMRAQLEEAGFEIVPFSEDAHVYVINTCSVTNIADRKSRQMISRAKKKRPDAVVVAAGCYVQTALEKTGKELDADILLGSGRKSRLVEELERYFAAMEAAQDYDRTRQGETVSDVMHEREYEALSLPRIEGHTRAWIKVQDGCGMFCSYCIIPFARGRSRSRRLEDVVKEVETLAGQGIREVVLTGIHLSSYGVDQYQGSVGPAALTWQERSGLMDLIEEVSRIKGIDRIRLGSLEPTIMTEAFIRRLSRVKEICPHFHLSLQSGCDSVLKRMNRHYTTSEYLDCLKLLRSVYDRPAITTDVIVGFPQESEEEFACTRHFLEQARLYETHLFRYSMRAGTRAAHMDGQIPEKVKEERLSELSAIDARMRKSFERSWDGSEVQVLFEEKVQIDDRGYICIPNSGRTQRTAEDLRITRATEKEMLYTGYTREYIRVFACSTEDLRGKILTGNLDRLKMRNLVG